MNVESREVAETTLAQVARGALVLAGDATCNWGAELDLVMVSRGLASHTKVAVN